MADQFDLDWNGEAIGDALEEAFHQANERLGDAFTQEITQNKWEWPNETERENGEVASSPRDIVDLGNLRRSYAPERATEGGDPAHDHVWNTEYAMPVHEGAKLANGKGTLPARPWTEEPLERGDLEKAFEALGKLALRRLG